MNFETVVFYIITGLGLFSVPFYWLWVSTESCMKPLPHEKGGWFIFTCFLVLGWAFYIFKWADALGRALV